MYHKRSYVLLGPSVPGSDCSIVPALIRMALLHAVIWYACHAQIGLRCRLMSTCVLAV
jgi:hypothetical protein